MNAPMRALRLLTLTVVCLLAAGSASAQATRNLTGNWQGSYGTVIQLRQSGATVTWFAQAADRKAWAHDFSGAISGNSITGTFQDRPGYQVYNRGQISARILNDCHFTITELIIGGGPPSAGAEQFTKTPCPPVGLETVPIASVSNGCGGAGWRNLVRAQNYLGNTSTYWTSNDLYNPSARPFTVDFVDACNLHDAGYSGAVVYDKLRGGIKDFRRWTRKQVDDKFRADMRLLCERQIPASAKIALTNCKGRGGNVSFGAESRYNFVRYWGHRFFDANLSQPGIQRNGERANDVVSWLPRPR